MSVVSEESAELSPRKIKDENTTEDAADQELLKQCYAIGLDAKALPSAMLTSISPPKFCLSLKEVDYVKLLHKALYLSKQGVEE